MDVKQHFSITFSQTDIHNTDADYKACWHEYLICNEYFNLV